MHSPIEFITEDDDNRKMRDEATKRLLSCVSLCELA